MVTLTFFTRAVFPRRNDDFQFSVKQSTKQINYMQNKYVNYRSFRAIVRFSVKGEKTYYFGSSAAKPWVFSTGH